MQKRGFQAWFSGPRPENPVHITRRGKRVAVILSEQEFNRLTRE